MGKKKVPSEKEVAELVQGKLAQGGGRLQLRGISLANASSSLTEVFSRGPALQAVNFSGCDLNATSLRLLLEALGMGELRELQLSSNPLGPDGAEVIAQFLPAAPLLERLSLGSASTGDGAQCLTAWLRNANALVAANLRCNGISAAVCAELLSAATANSTLEVKPSLGSG
ncbi:NLRC3 [Symbiodinium sp. CCMP2592]|nr:NLRC3 [Symbiodinium sp. CCMP2592]